MGKRTVLYLLGLGLIVEADAATTQGKPCSTPSAACSQEAPLKKSGTSRLADTRSGIMPARGLSPSREGSVSFSGRLRLSVRELSQVRSELLTAFASGQSSHCRTRLATITSYWARGSGTDRWTRRGLSSTGVPLRRGVVAVDPRVIPYGSVVKIEGIEESFLAADCGTAVLRRTAAIRSADNAQERRAIVVDVYFPTEREGRAFDSRLPKFVKVTYYPPSDS